MTNQSFLYSDDINSTFKDFQKSSHTLEFDKVINLVCEYAPTEGSVELLKKLKPSVSQSVVRELLQETTEAKQWISAKGTLSFGGIKNITPLLLRVEKGASLSMGELLQIASVLKTTENAKVYFEDRRFQEENLLGRYTQNLVSNKFLEEKITSSVLTEDMISDNATPDLYDIRRKKRIAANKVRDSLQKYISGTEHSKFLQENLITMRNGRYVVPVKSEYRNEIKGLLHDSSASGATVFIEPMSVVEANNEILLLESRETAEIAKILAFLSMECARFSDKLSSNYKTLTELGVIFAKAEFSFQTNSIEPEISKDNLLKLSSARHPLLPKDSVVPIDVVIGTDYTTLVITGPNTGGKTVTLKTIGLLCMMAQSGLHIPVSDGSSIPVFENILADIGDEQSIEQSLSTFSSHMVNIVDILKNITPFSLVLFDELGAGTDPIEGAALAETILEKVRSIGALCAATTHYAELKAYALEQKGVKNASCEFNIETLMPTYKLSIGLPGRSNAFAIAERLGFPKEMISEASHLITGESRRFEALIDKLEESRGSLESERENIKSLRLQLEQNRNEMRQIREEFNKKVQTETERAEKQARKLIDSAKASSEYIFAELDKIKKKKEQEDFVQSLEQAKKSIKSSIKKSTSKLSPVVEKIHETAPLNHVFKLGDRVLLSDINQQGDILQIDGENVLVQTGIIKTKTKKSNLLPIEDTNIEKIKQTYTNPKVSQNISAEIDLRGMISDDAWFATDRYIDSAILANLSQVTLIHGKGTGALRTALWKMLKNDNRIESFRQGAYGEGDSGVTVVLLKS